MQALQGRQHGLQGGRAEKRRIQAIAKGVVMSFVSTRLAAFANKLVITKLRRDARNYAIRPRRHGA